MNGTKTTINLPNKIGNSRGVLKVDGLDNFNPDLNIKLGKSR